MYDLVIRNARIADGLGNPLVEGDLAIKDGRVAAIGRISDDAAETFDAKGSRPVTRKDPLRARPWISP